MSAQENSDFDKNEALRARVLMAKVKSAFQSHVQPSLVALYASHHLKPEAPVQVGTGFLIEHQSRPVMITAKHVLRGHDLNEPPGEKAFHSDGKWVYVGDGSRCLFEAKDRDLTAFYADEVKSRPLLPAPAASRRQGVEEIITIGGFLSRDFKRHDDHLKPKPWIYSNKCAGNDNGIVSLLYPKRHNIASETGEAAFNSIPRGLSGGPMLDTVSLLRGIVEIVGIFTEQSDGVGRGECASCISSVLAGM